MSRICRPSLLLRAWLSALVLCLGIAGCNLNTVKLEELASQYGKPPNPAPASAPAPQLCSALTRADQRCCSGGAVPTSWCPTSRLSSQHGVCSVTSTSGTFSGDLFTCAPDPSDPGVTLTPFAQRNKNSTSHHWDPAWTYAIRDAIPSAMLGNQVPQDVLDVCPKFFVMTDLQKREFWAFLFQAVSVAESALSPVDRYRETGIPGVDEVTGNPIWSEGLLQLSYQDAPIFNCDFDWSVDRNMSSKDARKTIFDPERNLLCGVKILYRQIIVHKHNIFPSKNWYWSTLTKRAGNDGYDRVMGELKGVPSACKR